MQKDKDTMKKKNNNKKSYKYNKNNSIKNEKKKNSLKVKDEVIEIIDDNKVEDKIEIIDDNTTNKKDLLNKEKEKKKNSILVKILSILTIIVYLLYLTLLIIKNNITNNIIETLLIFIFVLCFIILCFKNKEKKNNIFIITGLIIIVSYSVINILPLIKNKELYVQNFYNMVITDVYKWKEYNENIDIEEIYEYSDLVSEYHIISQNVIPGTNINDISKIIFTISMGPNYNKEIIVPSFNGWKYDKVIAYLEKNFLNNIEFTFEDSTLAPNTVIYQDGSGTRKRNDLIKITFSKDEINPTEIIDFSNKSLLYATSWLQKNGFKYELKYDFNNTIKNNFIISQNITNEIKDPFNDTIILTISKGKIIEVPDFTKMNQDEINEWIINNNLKIIYNEIYSDKITLGDIIDSNIKYGDIVESGSTINLTISKGTLKMIKFATLDEFIEWANKYNIAYETVYEYSNTIKKDNIIKISHEENQIIKTEDTIIITISKGKSISIPNFVSMSKTNITNKCLELNLTCSFKYGGYTENIKKDIATYQSKKQNTIVSEGTSLIITLSSGIYEKVNVPSFTGQTKSEISTKCKNIGIVCNFNYQNNYSTVNADIAVSQSKTGTVNKGSSITITLTKGQAKSYNVVIDPNQLTSGNPTKSKETLKNKLESKCPGVTFVYIFEKANTAIGYIAESSEVKIGENILTQGMTYKVIINSN